MKSQIPIDHYLEAIREFQKKVPNAHVGGSIGLYLHGVDLKRPLGQSDIDMTIEDYLPQNFGTEQIHKSSSSQSDFDYNFHFNIGTQLYIKMEIRVCPEPSFDKIYHGEIYYNVSKKRDILFWKDKYARNGVNKHMNDLWVITGDEKYKTPTTIHVPKPFDDDLPF